MHFYETIASYVLHCCTEMYLFVVVVLFIHLPLTCLLCQVMIHYATADHEKERLKYFVSPEGRDDLYQYNQRERRNVLEVHLSS